VTSLSDDERRPSGAAPAPFGSFSAALRLRWLNWRNGKLKDPRFQRWAATFAFTRPIACKRASGLFDLVAGFVYSQVLAACVQLRLFDMLADGPRDAGALTGAMGLSPEAGRRLLRAAESLRLVEAAGDGSFVLGEAGAALFGNPGVLAMIEHHRLAYDDPRDPVGLLRGEVGETRLSRFWSYAGRSGDANPGEAEAYSRLMAASLPLLADDILNCYRLDRHRRMLDVGGGEGVFAAAAALRNPRLSVAVFDLPDVAARAQARFESLGLGERAITQGGSFFQDPLPRGADLVTLVRIAHDHEDDAVLALLRTVHACLPSGGTLLIAEPMATGGAADRVGHAYFGFYLLAMGQGRARTPLEFQSLLREAGFRSSRIIQTPRPMITTLIAAEA
jgi:demethylspheroidene O-methyltransferase